MAQTAAALAFVGGTLFEIGAYLGLLEAGNRGKHSDCEFTLFFFLDEEDQISRCWHTTRADEPFPSLSPRLVGSSLDRVLFGLEYAHSKTTSSRDESPSSSEKGDVEKHSSFDPDPDWEWM